jgi:hypothetical protein
MENTEFKTGDLILASDRYPVLPSSTRMKYLCTISNDKHLCVSPWEWDEDDFNSVTEYKFIDKLKIVSKVKRASEIIKWLEANEYKVTVQGSWMPTKKNMLIFSRNMFVECGKDFDLVKRPRRFMQEWLEECNNCG